MSVPQFIKCVSFQNQFWAIFLYLVALVFSLSIINIDEAVYANLYLGRLNMTSNISSTAFIDTINQVTSLNSYCLTSFINLKFFFSYRAGRSGSLFIWSQQYSLYSAGSCARFSSVTIVSVNHWSAETRHSSTTCLMMIQRKSKRKRKR